MDRLFCRSHIRPSWGRHLQRSWACLPLLSLLAGCGGNKGTKATPPVQPPPAPVKASVPGLFADVTQAAGIRFQMTNGATGKFYFVETTPGGCAFLDFDQDGWQDVFLVQSGPVPGSPPNEKRPPCALYHNNHDGTFTDVTQEVGLGFDQGYLQAVTVGDYNNDGYPDLFLSGYNTTHLLQNMGATTPKGQLPRFADVTAKAGVGEAGQNRWATSAAFGDYDGDGLLDLVVLHYAPWTPVKDIACYESAQKRKDYCSPELYGKERFTLWHNNRNGTFTDVSKKTKLDQVEGRGLAVAWVDYDQDGRDDLYIACDLTPNLLLHQEKDGTFKEVGLLVGTAYGPDGKTLSGMGIAVGDYENSGWESFVVTNFSGQVNSVYRATGKGAYEEVSYQSGVGTPSLNYLAFGISFLDYDRDGFRDLIVGNGHVDPYVTDLAPNVTYKQPKLLLRNQGNGGFTQVTEGLGDLTNPRVTRGLTVGDFNNDGRPDILTNNHNDTAELFQNRSTDTNHWVSFRLEGVKANRDGAGAMVWLTAGGKRFYSQARLASSYASSSDKRLFFGLGTPDKIEALEIRWPGPARTVQKLSNLSLAADTFYLLREGEAPKPDPLLAKKGS